MVVVVASLREANCADRRRNVLPPDQSRQPDSFSSSLFILLQPSATSSLSVLLCLSAGKMVWVSARSFTDTVQSSSTTGSCARWGGGAWPYCDGNILFKPPVCKTAEVQQWWSSQGRLLTDCGRNHLSTTQSTIQWIGRFSETQNLITSNSYSNLL